MEMEEKIRKEIFETLSQERGWVKIDDNTVIYSSNYCKGRIEWSANGLKVSFSLTTQKLACLARVSEDEQDARIRRGLFRHIHKKMSEEAKEIFPVSSVTGVNGEEESFYFEATSNDPAISWCITRLQLRCDRVVTIVLEKDRLLRARVLSDVEDVVKRIVNEDIFGDGK